MANRLRGFTLIELLITVAIAAIVIAIGVPSFREMMRNNRTAAHMNELGSALNLARSEAVKRGVNVGVVPNNGSWTLGWTAFVDANGNNTLDDNDLILRAYSKLEGNPTINGGVTSIFYQGNGAVVGGSKQLGYILDASDSGTARTICINPVGRSSIVKGSISCP